MANLTIIKANKQNAKDLANLYIEFDSFNKKMNPQTPIYSLNEYEQWAITQITRTDQNVYLVKDTLLNSILGYMTYYEIPQESSYFLKDLFVKKEYRKKNIGKMLIKLLLQKSKGKKVTTEVYTWNKRALKFYKQLGFEVEENVKILIKE